ncbi:hypothetical protein ACNOYE_24055 [Nannocystaceae bacterium ST9]
MTRLRTLGVVLALASLVPVPAWASPPEPARPHDPDTIHEIHAYAPEPVVEGPVEAETDAEIEPASEDVVEPPPPNMPAGESIRVAVGLSPEVLGDKTEKALLDRLEVSVRASSNPRTEVRRLRAGAAEARVLCREGRDDLIIVVGYLPERPEPVLLSYDCRIDEELGVRASLAADEADLVGVLWAEHATRVAAGARERRRNVISPKVKTGLIAGAAVLVIGAAITLLIVGAASRETVVIKVSPENP